MMSVTTDTVVNRDTVGEPWRKIAALGLRGPIYIVLDNARYQPWGLVQDLARQRNSALMFLPSFFAEPELD